MSKQRYAKHPWSENLQLRGVELWSSKSAPKLVDIEIENGTVKRITASDSNSGLVLLPAGVDTQVHLRVPGQPEKETADSGLMAALHGGVGALLTMPNTKPFIDSVENLKLGMKEVSAPSQELGVEVLFSACATKQQQGKELAPIRELAEAGAVAFTDDGKGVAEDSIMDQVFAQLSGLQTPFLQHAETLGAPGPLAEGPLQEKLGLAPYTAKFETDMLDRDLQLLTKHPNVRYHLLHISSRESLPLLLKARASGLRVTSEITPHHLYFSSHDITENNKSFKMNPPLRGPEDRSQLQSALTEGVVDWMATDHAPHESSSKTKEFPEASFGTVGMETSLMVLLWLNQQGKLSPQRLVETWTTKPAKFLSIEQEFGDIEVGKSFRAVLIDPKMKTSIEENFFWGLSKNSCFLGTQLPGRILGHATRSGWFEFN